MNGIVARVHNARGQTHTEEVTVNLSVPVLGEHAEGRFELRPAQLVPWPGACIPSLPTHSSDEWHRRSCTQRPRADSYRRSNCQPERARAGRTRRGPFRTETGSARPMARGMYSLAPDA